MEQYDYHNRIASHVNAKPPIQDPNKVSTPLIPGVDRVNAHYQRGTLSATRHSSTDCNRLASNEMREWVNIHVLTFAEGP